MRFILSGGGHIAGIINPPAENKRGYWINENDHTDPESWIAGAKEKEGSWWNDWFPWLAEHSGAQIDPPSMGNDTYKPLMDAPGTYVLEE